MKSKGGGGETGGGPVKKAIGTGTDLLRWINFLHQATAAVKQRVIPVTIIIDPIGNTVPLARWNVLAKGMRRVVQVVEEKAP